MTTLRPYQKKGARAIYDFDGRALLADEMGLGKTLQVLYWMVKMGVRPVIVVCPASVKYVWEHEAAHHVGMMSEVLEGTKIPRLRSFGHAPLLIINYDILYVWAKYLRRLKPMAVVIDECHYIKNFRSRRFKACEQLCVGVRYVIGVSGTPLTNRPAEMWSILHLLYPTQYDSFIRYARRYCYPRKMPWGWVYTGAQHLDELHAKLRRTCMIRRLKKDVLSELPAKERYMVPAPLSDRKEYEQARDDFLNWLAAQDAAKANRAKRAKAMVHVGYLLRLVARLKVPFIYDWVDSFLIEGTSKKLVIFTKHRRMVELLHDRYGRRSVFVDGRVKGRDRQQAVHQFQTDPRTHLFIGNMVAAGVGCTLTAASTVAFTDLPWTPGELVQAEDRIHRIGQKATATIYYLVALNTIEERLMKILQSKQEVLGELLDGGKGFDELSVFNELLRKYEPKQK